MISARLKPHAERLAGIPVRALYASDSERAGRFSRELDGLLLDFSRQRIDAEAITALCDLADASGLRARVDAMFGGAVVNVSEQRQALHTLLRAPAGAALPKALAPLHAEVCAVRAQCAAFVREVHSGKRAGAGGARFTDVVNIGIGGSDLGPSMAVAALVPFHVGELRCHFVSNVDGTQFADLAPVLDPARTLVIVCSKTFTTQETLANARRVRGWLAGKLGEAAVPRHFAAVSTNAAAMDEFGVGRDARFAMWDWVGGRYSLWSAVGLSLELAIGTEHFEALLAGARAMDEHFRTSAWGDNLPVLLGLLAVWNRNALGFETHAVLPYSQRLARLPAYLQQLEMESLGKCTTRKGLPVEGETGAVIWGEPGSNAQHSFFQLLHQGTAEVSMDFLLPLAGAADAAADELVIANCLAQAQALMQGHDAKEPHRFHPGSRPLSLLVFPRLDPKTLGSIVALYEHKVFVESVLWDINPFDQWGVELGKQLCNSLLPLRESRPPAELEGIAGWIARHR
ncbi:MAG: glucose-6-phosphate isomerase [Steroidobacteraceae bacterium]